MNGCGKSDTSIVPKKPSNKVETFTAEGVEGRGVTKGNGRQQNTRQTQGWESVYSALQLVHRKAKMDKKMQFTALMHHVYNVETLRHAYATLKRDAAPGVDRETWRSYGQHLEVNLLELSSKLKCGGYRAKPVRRVYIPKPNGQQRALGVTALEDKIVQRAAVEVMNAIYEADFIGFSYGFRPGRSQHQALDALSSAIMMKKVNYVLDADISDFFGSISHEWLVKFIEHRIGDKRIIRLIQKWLKAGVLEQGQVEYTERGTPQGGSGSPLLANVYLHYVYDLWVQQWRKQHARGDVIVVRFADDTIAGFQYQSDAERFHRDLKKRLERFGLKLHPDKTHLLEFGRYAAERRLERNKGKPENFDFLGFTHVCGKTPEGKFSVRRLTIKKRMRAKIRLVKAGLRRRMHAPVPEVGQWLRAIILGHNRYYGVPGNSKALNDFRYRVYWHWRRVLNRRSRKGYVTWARMRRLIDRWLPRPRICHPYPLERLFGV